MRKKQSKVDSLYEMIDRGRSGLNIGVSTGLTKLDSVISGIQKQRFYLIAGGTGSGKTTLCLYSFIYQPLKEKLGKEDFEIVYYSLEMTAEMLYAKLLSMYIYDQFDVRISYEDIFSNQVVLGDEYYNHLIKAKDWLVEVDKHLIVYDKSLTTKGLYAHLKSYAEANGVFQENEDGSTTTYIPKVKNKLTLIVLDHVWLLTPLEGQTQKIAVDVAAKYLLYFRNKCGFSPIAIQQLNRQNSSMDRRKEKMQLPELQDLKGTGDVAEAAEVVIALFNPVKEKMSSWEGYDIRTFKDNFRAICVLKNRYGTVDKVVPCGFYGDINYFRQLPKADTVNALGTEIFLNPSFIESKTISDANKVKQETETFLFTL